MSCDTDLPYKEDRQHLLGVSPQFASQTDLLLCVKDGDHMLGFPVHAMIISAHSPVLCEVLESTSIPRTPREGDLPRLPMTSDSRSAVCSALACIYRYLPLSAMMSQAKAAYPEPEISLDSAAVHASHMRFYDKYGMTRVAEMQTKALMTSLRRCTQLTSLTKEQISQVLECTAAAEDCKLVPLLALCEAIIIRHFAAVSLDPQLMTSKLSSASMLRVAQGCIKLEQDTFKDLETTLQVSVAEGKQFNEWVHKVMLEIPEHAPLVCPRCRSNLCKKHYDNEYQQKYGPPPQLLLHECKCKCANECQWPDIKFTQKPICMQHIIHGVAVSHQIPVEAIGTL